MSTLIKVPCLVEREATGRLWLYLGNLAFINLTSLAQRNRQDGNLSDWEQLYFHDRSPEIQATDFVGRAGEL